MGDRGVYLRETIESSFVIKYLMGISPSYKPCMCAHTFYVPGGSVHFATVGISHAEE